VAAVAMGMSGRTGIARIRAIRPARRAAFSSARVGATEVINDGCPDTNWLDPPSHLLRADLAATLEENLKTRRIEASLDDLEYRVGLVEYLISNGHHLHAGDFIAEERWTYDQGVEAERRFRRDAERASNSWRWWSLLKSP
jgi:hypothetical protein